MLKGLSFIFLSVLALVSCNPSVKKNGVNTQKQNTVQVQDTLDRQYRVKVGDPAPDFEMALPDGKKIKLSDLRGRVVMLQFTASWCGVCRKEMPHIEKEIWQKHKDNPQFALYGIDREEPAEKIQSARGKRCYLCHRNDPGCGYLWIVRRRVPVSHAIHIDRRVRSLCLPCFEEEEFNEMVSLIDKLLRAMR